MATIIGGPGDDTEVGTNANDLIALGGGDDAGFGLQGNDVLRGEAGDDVLSGGDGRDRLVGGGGNDTLFGDSGNDVLNGDNGADWLYGGGGNDVARGGNGEDLLFGRDGDDQLFGGAGNDIIEPGAGSNTVSGGAGADEFVLAVSAPVPGGLTLAEFADALDALCACDPDEVQDFVDGLLSVADDVDTFLDVEGEDAVIFDTGLGVPQSALFAPVEADIGGDPGTADFLVALGASEGIDFTGASFFKMVVLIDPDIVSV